MYLAVQPSLIERTVFEMARRDETMRPLYERQFSQCYEQRDPTARDQAFADLHERWFDDTGLRKRILAVIDEFTHIRGAVSRLMVTQASGPRAQTAELFGSPGKYTVEAWHEKFGTMTQTIEVDPSKAPAALDFTFEPK